MVVGLTDRQLGLQRNRCMPGVVRATAWSGAITIHTAGKELLATVARLQFRLSTGSIIATCAETELIGASNAVSQQWLQDTERRIMIQLRNDLYITSLYIFKYL